uniref:Uncharacterized protein n=1 Tax=Oryza nivara TaxID=4536 RepID=A0A0E0HRV1_ORYNI
MGYSLKKQMATVVKGSARQRCTFEWNTSDIEMAGRWRMLIMLLWRRRRGTRKGKESTWGHHTGRALQTSSQWMRNCAGEVEPFKDRVFSAQLPAFLTPPAMMLAINRVS